MELDKLILKFMGKNKRLKAVKTKIEKLIRKKNTRKNYLESDYNKNLWHQCRFRQRDQPN